MLLDERWLQGGARRWTALLRAWRSDESEQGGVKQAGRVKRRQLDAAQRGRTGSLSAGRLLTEAASVHEPRADETVWD